MGVITKLDYSGHFYAFKGLFLMSRYRMGDLFYLFIYLFIYFLGGGGGGGGLLKFQIFFGGA